MERFCSSCTHWSEDDQIRDFRCCTRVKAHDSIPTNEPFLLDPSYLYTPPGFGCAMWEGEL